MISVRVLFFGKLADLVEQAEFRCDVEPNTSVADLYRQLASQSQLQPLEQNPGIKVAINQQLSDWEQMLTAGDELAFLPPVTGG